MPDMEEVRRTALLYDRLKEMGFKCQNREFVVKGKQVICAISKLNVCLDVYLCVLTRRYCSLLRVLAGQFQSSVLEILIQDVSRASHVMACTCGKRYCMCHVERVC